MVKQQNVEKVKGCENVMKALYMMFPNAYFITSIQLLNFFPKTLNEKMNVVYDADL
jgi:hypothetical protein